MASFSILALDLDFGRMVSFFPLTLTRTPKPQNQNAGSKIFLVLALSIYYYYFLFLLNSTTDVLQGPPTPPEYMHYSAREIRIK